MLNSPAALSNINTPAFTRDAENARCSQSDGFFEGWQVAGFLPLGKGDTFNIMLGQHSAKVAKYPEDNSSLLQQGESLKSGIFISIHIILKNKVFAVILRTSTLILLSLCIW
jgi:hypothetical protein